VQRKEELRTERRGAGASRVIEWEAYSTAALSMRRDDCVFLELLEAETGAQAAVGPAR
jgi:hypothetical protein